MSTEGKIVIGLIVLVIVICGIIIGPAGCDRKISAWKAGAYGSDWLVVQYSQDGSVMNSWELKNKSIGNESQSDGIYFTDVDGNVIHLSGHYIYIETKDFKSAKERYFTKWW